MREFKFGGFTVGQSIKAFDHAPMEGRPDRFLVGTVEQVNDDPADRFGGRDYAHYVVRVTQDATFGPDHNRVGLQAYIPMQSSMDYDGRVSAV